MLTEALHGQFESPADHALWKRKLSRRASRSATSEAQHSPQGPLPTIRREPVVANGLDDCRGRLPRVFHLIGLATRERGSTMARDLTKIRNIGIAAHIDAGKTTTYERIQVYPVRGHEVGEVHEGTAVMDFDPEEQKRGITINSAATFCEWKRNGEIYNINLIDTPGHVDFTAEVERSLRVLDGAVAVFDGKEGVEAQSETVWRQATKYNVPRICFVNKMDKVGADYEFCYRTILDRLGAPAIPVVIPDGEADQFKGIIDLIRGVGYYTDMDNEKDKGQTITTKPVPEHMKEK